MQATRHDNTTGWYRWEGDRLVLNVRVLPRGSRDEVLGPANDRLRIRVTAAPTDGNANRRLVRLLAREFKVAKSRITIESGATSRAKRLVVAAPRRVPEWLPG